MEIIYSFKTTDCYIYEVKYTEVSENPPVTLQYQWFILKGNQNDKLIFDKMTEETRNFKNGTCLNLVNLTYHDGKQLLNLKKCDEKDLLIIKKLLN